MVVSVGFDVVTEVKQGDYLSPLHFNAVWNGAIKKAEEINTGVSVGSKINVLGCAYDIQLTATRQQMRQQE